MVDPFNLNKSKGFDAFSIGINKPLRAGFDKLIDDHPHYLVYVRRDMKYPHPDCYLPDTKSPDPSCADCFGLGYYVQFEKHKCRRALAVRDVQAPVEEFGYLAQYKYVVYTPRYYYPKRKDLYLEVEWDVSPRYIEDAGRPTNIIHAYQITESLAQLEDEVTYTCSGCDTYDFTVQQMENWLLTMSRVWVPKVVV